MALAAILFVFNLMASSILFLVFLGTSRMLIMVGFLLHVSLSAGHLFCLFVFRKHFNIEEWISWRLKFLGHFILTTCPVISIFFSSSFCSS
jgi:hypothetical protein